MQMASIVLPRPGAPIAQGAPGQRPRLLDEGGVEGAQHELALEVGTKPKVELLDARPARREREAGLAQPPVRGGLGAGGGFLLEQALEQVGVGQFFAGGAVEPRGPHGRTAAA
jgi:hypothetical protein